MGKITLILGGARSGKSSYAVSLAKKNPGKTVFIATCRPSDSEMKKRAALHKKARPCAWKTVEETENLHLLLERIGLGFDTVIIDCLTLLASDLMLKGASENAIKIQIKKILKALKKIKTRSLIVSNEVGLGIVPENKLARGFRDTAGRLNQIVAEKADNVIFMVSGIPWRIK